MRKLVKLSRDIIRNRETKNRLAKNENSDLSDLSNIYDATFIRVWHRDSPILGGFAFYVFLLNEKKIAAWRECTGKR